MPPRETPRKSKASRAKQGNNGETSADWGGWIDIKITEDEKASFHAWYEQSSTSIMDWVYAAVGEGLKFGLSRDEAHECFVASLNGKGDSTSDLRFSLTARATDAHEATGLVLFKHYTLLDGDWKTYKPSNQYQSNWG